MPTATKKQKTRTEPLTFEQVAEKKLRGDLERYRGFAERAAAGEYLDEAELEQVAQLMSGLRLPELAWGKHLEALREMAAAQARQAELDAKRPAEEERLRELSDEVKELEELLERKRLELKGAQTNELRIVDALRKQNELRALYPDVVAALDIAVSRRLNEREQVFARYRDKPTGSPEEGWSR